MQEFALRCKNFAAKWSRYRHNYVGMDVGGCPGSFALLDGWRRKICFLHG